MMKLSTQKRFLLVFEAFTNFFVCIEISGFI